jgi:cyclohexadienyl dehydratase
MLTLLVTQIVVFFGTTGVLCGPSNKEANSFAGGRLTVGTTGDYPPLTLWLEPYDHNLGPTGFSIAAVQVIAAEMNLELDYVPTTWPTLSKDLQSGRFHLGIGGISASAARAQNFLLSLPLLVDGKVPLVRCEHVDRYTTLEAINKPSCRVVENKGGTNQEFATQWLPHSQLAVKYDNKMPFEALANGEADVMITDAIEARYRAGLSNGTLCVANVESLFTEQFKVFMVRAGDEALLRRLNAAILRSKPLLKELKMKLLYT